MGAHQEVTAIKLWVLEQLDAGTTLTSSVIDLGNLGQTGHFSMQVAVSGTGTSVAMIFKESNDGVNYINGISGYKIAHGTSAFHHMCGKDANGRHLISFDAPVAAFMKIYAYETVSATGCSITATLAVQ